jgi:4-hydroxyphenylacetate 3-monooxygenase
LEDSAEIEPCSDADSGRDGWVFPSGKPDGNRPVAVDRRRGTVGARTGEQFLKGLREGSRQIWIGDERVEDVTEHPALMGGAHALARHFDMQHEFADDCLMADPETGEPINVSHIIPRSKSDLARRRVGLLRAAETSVGLVGRSPEYMNVTYAGFAGRRAEWAGAHGENSEGAENLVEFQKQLARDDLSLTHTIVHPTFDKMQEHAFLGSDVPLHKVADTEHGIVVRGARILATLAPFSDEIAVYPGFPLPEGGERYALSFSIPMTTPGLIALCRDSASLPGTNYFDHPLSTRFDEQDAFMIFDDVEVPRDRIFIDTNLGTYNTVMQTAWWPNIMQQTTLRAQTKLEFAYELLVRMSEAIHDETVATQEMLGEVLGYAEMTRSAVMLAEEHAYDYGDGIWFPDGRPLHPMRAALAEWFPRVSQIFHILGSHNLLAAPSRAMLDDPQLRPLIDEFLDGFGDVDAVERARIFRLAWDFVGSALANRSVLYESHYLGSVARNRRMAGRYAHREDYGRLVDNMLEPGRRLDAQ